MSSDSIQFRFYFFGLLFDRYNQMYHMIMRKLKRIPTTNLALQVHSTVNILYSKPVRFIYNDNVIYIMIINDSF